MKINIKSVKLILASITIAMVSLWFLLWVMSSYSLAFTFCDEFGLFHEKFRCRQPYIAIIGFVTTGASSIALFVMGIKANNNAKNT